MVRGHRVELASLIVVYSSTGSLAFRVRGGNTSYYLIKQLFLMFGCMVVILTLQSFHYKYFLSFAKIVLGMSLIFLLWAKFAGTTLNDAGRWVTIPGIGVHVPAFGNGETGDYYVLCPCNCF